MIPLNQEESLVQTAEPASEIPEPERTLVLVAELETVLAIAKSEIALQSTPISQPTTAIASQEFLTTPITTQTFLLLTLTPIYDRTASPAVFEPQQSLTSHSQHIEKVPPGDPSSAEVLLNAAKVRWIYSWPMNILSWPIKLNFKLINKG